MLLTLVILFQADNTWVVQEIVKGVFGGGDGASNVIQTFNFQTEGNCSDFGTTTGRLLAGCGNEIVCLFGGGDNAPSYYNIIDEISYATTGNAVDFGDLQAGECSCSNC